MIFEVFRNENQINVAAFPIVAAGIRTIKDQFADVDVPGFNCFPERAIVSKAAALSMLLTSMCHIALRELLPYCEVFIEN
jgi:hypothetical protein